MPEPSSEAPQAGDRLRRAFLHPGRGQVVAAVLVGLLAFAGVTQIRSNQADDAYAGMRQADLVQTLNGLAAAQRRTEAEIGRLQRIRDDLRSSSRRRQAAIRQARRDLATLGVLSGTLPTSGPGVVVTVTPGRNPLGTNHLLDGIEELRDAGAEAIQINNSVRVVAQTSFADAANGIRADGRLLRPPYRIAAVGDSRTLARALVIGGGFVDSVQLGQEGTVQVLRRREVRVVVTRSPQAPQYAQPVG